MSFADNEHNDCGPYTFADNEHDGESIGHIPWSSVLVFAKQAIRRAGDCALFIADCAMFGAWHSFVVQYSLGLNPHDANSNPGNVCRHVFLGTPAH